MSEKIGARALVRGNRGDSDHIIYVNYVTRFNLISASVQGSLRIKGMERASRAIV